MPKTVYQCPACEATLQQCSNWQKHLKRKRPCGFFDLPEDQQKPRKIVTGNSTIVNNLGSGTVNTGSGTVNNINVTIHNNTTVLPMGSPEEIDHLMEQGPEVWNRIFHDISTVSERYAREVYLNPLQPQFRCITFPASQFWNNDKVLVKTKEGDVLMARDAALEYTVKTSFDQSKQAADRATESLITFEEKTYRVIEDQAFYAEAPEPSLGADAKIALYEGLRQLGNL